MSKIESHEYEEDEKEYAEFDLAGQGLLLPSQTRNPAFGIWPQLEDDWCVVRYPEYNYSSGCPLKTSPNPQLRVLYDTFSSMAFNEACLNGRKSSVSEDALLSRLNTRIRKGDFQNEMGKLLEVTDGTLRRYVHTSTYQAIHDYWARTIRRG